MTLGKAVRKMAVKSANVVAHVGPDIKEKAEIILTNLEISTSTAINMLYRQVGLWNGIPFRPAIPTNRPVAHSEMSDTEFDERMAVGIAQAKADQSYPVDETFSRLISEPPKAQDIVVLPLSIKI